VPEQEKLFFLKNQKLFSNNYLEHRLQLISLWNADNEKVHTVFENIKHAYKSIQSLNLGPGEEANLEDKFIRPVLASLDYEWDVQPTTQRGARKRRPDYALFKDKDSHKEARKGKNNPQYFYTYPLTILEAKYWGRSLNDTDPKDILDSRDPTAQTVKYLDDVYHASNSRIQWAILTNGKIWRLFYYRATSRSGNYYEADLEEIINSNNPDIFKYFYLFFSKDAFIPDPVTGKTWLDQHIKGSEDYAARVSENLKNLIFDKIFEGLAKGFIEYRYNEKHIKKETDEDLKEIFNGCLTLLYRLLFLLYAESRALLPVNDQDRYYKKSLKRLKEDIASELEITIAEGMSHQTYDYWSRLESLCRIIERGDKALNIPIYNGGLFETQPESFLATNKISDPFLVNAISLLTIDQQGEYTPGQKPFIDYSSLDVRHLGNIYEGLLEFHIRIADEPMVEIKEGSKILWKKESEIDTNTRIYRRKEKGEIYIENSKHERKATGSYYTPHYIVEYIVKNTVGPVLEIRFQRANEILSELEVLYEKQRKQLKKPKDWRHWDHPSEPQGPHIDRIIKLEEDLFETVFDLKVLDPAMGSGHFLVHTVDFITDKIIAFLANFPENPVIRKIEKLKHEILDGIKRQGVSIDENKLTEINLMKRTVMKRCIYGVDLNEMAVELAKLSLWLDSFVLGAPLSFLDHHLKCGNSLIGSNLETVKNTVKGKLFTIDLEPLNRAIRNMLFVSNLSDATYQQVKDSEQKYRDADKNIGGYRILLDILVSEYFGIEGAKSFLLEKGSMIDMNNLEKSIESMYKKDREVIKSIEKIAEEKRFFHWEIEFPEVFFERVGAREQKAEKKEYPGFDCVIGNPPYVRIQKMEEVSTKKYLKAYQTTHKNYDIYVPFVERGVSLLSLKGYFCYIMPNKFLQAEYAEKLRAYIVTKRHLKSIVNFGHNQVFSGEATTYTCLLFLAGGTHYSFDYIEIQKLSDINDMASILVATNSCKQVRMGHFSLEKFSHLPWIFGLGNEAQLLDKLKKQSISLCELVDQIIVGLQTSADNIYIVKKLGEDKAGIALCYSTALKREVSIEKSILKPLISGVNIDRYELTSPISFLIFPYQLIKTDHRAELISENCFKKDFPLTWQYLKCNEPLLRNREKNKFDDIAWYRFGRHQNLDKQWYPKLAIPRLIDRLKSLYDKNGEYYLDNVDVNGILLKRDSLYKPEYILALLNSRLIDYVFKKGSVKFRGEYYSANKQFIAFLPIARITFATPEKRRKERVLEAIQLYQSEMVFKEILNYVEQGLGESKSDTIHDVLVHLAKQMIEMNKKKNEEIEGFLKWLEREISLEIDELSNKTAIKEYHEHNFNQLIEILKRNRSKLSIDPSDRKTQEKLEDQFTQSISILEPLKTRIKATDELIDEIVYKLYGLTEEEIKIVKGEVSA